MGFLGRVGASLVGGAVTKWALGVGAVAVMAGLVGFGAYMYLKGGLANDAKWITSVLRWEREQAETNKRFDQTTQRKNTDFMTSIQEIDQKWRAKPSQQ